MARAEFQDRCLKPLGHPSLSTRSMTCDYPTKNVLATVLDPTWTQSPQHALKHRADDCGGLRVRALGTLGIGTQQHCGIVATSLRDDMHDHTSVEQRSFMRTAQIVQP